MVAQNLLAVCLDVFHHVFLLALDQLDSHADLPVFVGQVNGVA